MPDISNNATFKYYLDLFLDEECFKRYAFKRYAVYIKKVNQSSLYNLPIKVYIIKQVYIII